MSISASNRLKHDRLLLVAAWLLCGGLLLWLYREAIGSFTFSDPDDPMRLVQVRDWLNGQAFRDVTQYRANPPMGGPMHWSRIVDAPIAALILLLRPLLGTALAETVACAVIPLLLLGATTAALHGAARRIGGRALGLVAALLLLTSPSILLQFVPLRIDHHGWQIALAALALAGVLDAREVRGGAVAGLALALWLQISSEGLPYAALIGAALALWQWADRRQTARFVAYAIALGTATPLLLLTLQGAAALLGQQCDALSAVYAWPLAALGIATAIAARLLGSITPTRRLGIAAIGGGVALLLFAAIGGPCLSGDPFAPLGPTAYRLWYLGVMEGRPVWEQPLARMGIILLPPLVGLAAALTAARIEAERRSQWLMLALLIAGSTLVAALVMRALSVAHLFAIPAIGWALIALFRRSQVSLAMTSRVLGPVALLGLTPIGLCTLWIAAAPSPTPNGPQSAGCRGPAMVRALGSLPSSLIFAPLDLGPDILLRTAHKVVGTAHHRNAAGITAVIEGFTATPPQARTIVARLDDGRGATYLLTCTGLTEVRQYAVENPKGLAAALARGDVPAWLEPMPVAQPLRLYRVRAPQAGVKASATPFMQ